MNVLESIFAQQKENRVNQRAFARAFATEDGKKVLAVLEQALGWHEPSAVGSETIGIDIHQTLFRDGMKGAIKFIHDMQKAGAAVVADDEAGKSFEYTPRP